MKSVPSHLKEGTEYQISSGPLSGVKCSQLIFYHKKKPNKKTQTTNKKKNQTPNFPL